MPGISCVSSGQRCAVERSDIEKENDHKDLCTFGNAANLVATLRPKRNAKLHSLKERGALRPRPRPVLELVGNQNIPGAAYLDQPRLPGKTHPNLLVQESSAQPAESEPETPTTQKSSQCGRLAGSPPALPKRVSVSPQAMPAGGNAQRSQSKSSNTMLLQAVPSRKSFVKVRVRRTLNLQAATCTADGGRVLRSSGRHNRCTRSADDIQLNHARLQPANGATVTRSAEWPVPSCIRKRTEESTGYEMPRKSFKQAAESQSWQAGAAYLAKHIAKLSVHDMRACTTFGETTVIGQ